MAGTALSAPSPAKTVLHVGCGPEGPGKLPSLFQGPEWREVRLDIDSGVKPDVVASITAMTPVADATMDGIWSSHNLEHLYAHEVPLALGEFFRVLKPGGLALLTMPDLQSVAAAVVAGRLEDSLYTAPVGPISAIDVLYGHRPAIARGNVFMAHKTGFTATTLKQKLETAGFRNVRVTQGDSFDLWAVGHKLTSAAELP